MMIKLNLYSKEFKIIKIAMFTKNMKKKLLRSIIKKNIKISKILKKMLLLIKCLMKYKMK